MNKKKIIITIALFSTIILLNFVYFSLIPTYLSGKIGKEAVKNQFLTENERKLCKNDCLKSFLEKTLQGIKDQTIASDLSPDKGNQEALEKALNSKNYFRFNQLYREEMTKFYKSFEQYEAKNSFSKKDILNQDDILGGNIIFNKKDYRITNFHYLEGYIIFNIIPTNNTTDAAIVIVTHDGGIYKRVAGPGTYFEVGGPNNLPKEVVEYVNNRPSSAGKLDPLLKYLPYNSPNNKFFIDYGNTPDKIVYEVTIYAKSTQEAEVIKKDALNWILSKAKSLDDLEIVYTIKPIITPTKDYLE